MNPINAGTMADIAFLLLIFFLVATKINEDKGLTVILPSYKEDIIVQGNTKRNILKVMINSQDEIWIDDAMVEMKEVKEKSKSFVLATNEVAKSDKQKAIVIFKNGSDTSYGVYVKVYGLIKGAFKELRQEYAWSQYNKRLYELDKEEMKEVVSKYPIQISESEHSVKS